MTHDFPYWLPLAEKIVSAIEAVGQLLLNEELDGRLNRGPAKY